MEMSRQRLRTGVLEASTKPAPIARARPHAHRLTAGLSALRMIEDEAARGRGEKIQLRAGREAAIYLLNRKRAELAEIEGRYGVSIDVAIDESFEGARMSVESSGPRPTAPQRRPEPTPIEEDLEEVEALLGEDFDEDEHDEEEEEEERETSQSEDDRPGRRRRRRRRGGRGRNRREGSDAPAEPQRARANERDHRRSRSGSRVGRSRKTTSFRRSQASQAPRKRSEDAAPIADEAARRAGQLANG